MNDSITSTDSSFVYVITAAYLNLNADINY